MKIALTGSSGRVGSAILELALADGHELVCLDRVAAPPNQQRPGVTFVQADMADYDAFEGALIARLEGLAVVAVRHLEDAEDAAATLDGNGEEALRMGLANRLVAPGESLVAATSLARDVASRPQAALRSDRLSSYEQWSLSLPDALANEFEHGLRTIRTRELVAGLERYASGSWRASRA